MAYRPPDCIWRVCVVDFPGIGQVDDRSPQEEACGRGFTRLQRSAFVWEGALALFGVVGSFRPTFIIDVGLMFRSYYFRMYRIHFPTTL